jgi:hypothetical protein
VTVIRLSFIRMPYVCMCYRVCYCTDRLNGLLFMMEHISFMSVYVQTVGLFEVLPINTEQYVQQKYVRLPVSAQFYKLPVRHTTLLAS